MAPRRAFVALLSFFGAASAQSYTSDDYYESSSSRSAFWTVTSRYAALVTASPYTRANGAVTTYTITDRQRTVKSTVVPTATPTSTSSYSNYVGVQVVYQYYGLNAVAATDLEAEYDDDLYSSTTRSTITTSVRFSMPVTMTAPASCPTQFTVTTSASVTVPSMVQDQVKPTSTVAGSTTTYGSSMTYVIQTWYLSASAAPFTSTDDYYYRYYIRSCSTPPAARSTSSDYYYGGGSGGGSSSGGSDNDSSSSSDYCYRYSYYCGTPLMTWIIVIATVIPGLFLLGFLESWFWFRRLMTGKSAMRFGTVCWVLISLWVLCFTRMQDARSKEDQKLLQEKWKTMGSGAAFKAWWKWGFRHKYPEEHLGQFSKLTVGVVPAGQPLHPAMAQAPPGFMPGPPPPGAPGQVYYYGPPPGWIPTPDGQGFMPPQGYVYPPPQQAGYYGGDLSKDGTTVSSSPVSQHPAMAQQPQGQAVSPIGTSPAQPQAPQPVYHANGAAPTSAPSPPPQGPVPATPVAQPTSHVSEAPANPAPTATGAPQIPPLKNDPNDRSLYE